MRKTLLLADDSPTIRRIVELTFCETEIRVEAVGSGSEAVDLLDRLEPDLVLADVVMPEPSGYELCRRIKAANPTTPVLLLTGTFESFDPEQARQCGADDHLVKPFESLALQSKVEQLLSRPAQAPPPEVVEVVEVVEIPEVPEIPEIPEIKEIEEEINEIADAATAAAENDAVEFPPGSRSVRRDPADENWYRDPPFSLRTWRTSHAR